MKRLYVLCSSVVISALITAALISVNCFIESDAFWLDISAFIGVVVSFCLLFILLLEFISGLYKVKLDETEIAFCKGNRVCKKVQYSDIEALSIVVAADYYWNPILDEEKKKCMAISAFSSEQTASLDIAPDSIIRMPRAHLKKPNSDGVRLFCYVYENEDLIKILKYTKASIYITEEAYSLCSDKLKGIENSVFVSCFDDNGDKILKPAKTCSYDRGCLQ